MPEAMWPDSGVDGQADGGEGGEYDDGESACARGDSWACFECMVRSSSTYTPRRPYNHGYTASAA